MAPKEPVHSGARKLCKNSSSRCVRFALSTGPLLTIAVDPEVKAELEDMQKNQKGMASSATNLQNMDIASDFASWMAGSSESQTAKRRKVVFN